MAKEAKKQDPQQQLEALFNKLVKQHSEFTQPLVELPEHEFAKAALIQGLVEGNLTPPVMLIALTEGHWEYAADTAKFDDLAYQLLSDIEGDWPVYAVVDDGLNQRILALFGADGSDGTHGADTLPGLEELRSFDRMERDPTFRWSMRVYTRLMQRFDAFHENVYRVTKDKVNDKNDIIEEVAKLLFLETFRLHHDEDLTFKDDEGNTLRFRDVFDWQYVESHGDKAVAQIKAAFEEFKNHENYVVISDDGSRNPIFSKETHLRLSVAKNYQDLLEAIQNLGPVKTNDGKIAKEHGTLADVSGDLLGRVFDVFLRANFESKGGLGVYLTPNPVKQAMLEIAMHDIDDDDEMRSRLANGDFRFCDPTCGSFGFGSVALSQIDKWIDFKLVLADDKKESLKQKLRDCAFTGADAAPRMVMLARVNMALQGAPKAQIFYTDNSLTTNALKPNSFDLICTNPPFGTPKFDKGKNGQNSKANYEANMEQVLGGFRPTKKVVDSYNAWYDHVKMKWEDIGDLELDENGEPKWAGYRTDLRRTGGTDKKPFYSLQPTTAGLALGSKPDSKGNWQPVGATIDPAVLFIDRCLQLLKPGGRLLIVLPDGILCNSGDRYVREYIMGKKDEKTGEFVGGKAIVKAVISLPSDCFKLSGTGAKTSILYLQKRHANPNQPEQFLPEPQTDVFMAVAETLGYVVKNNIEDYNAGVANDLDKIVSAYKRGV
ncbi:class I SAM-dependent DNA methyltransferase [Escherichia coli]|uniref:HsdM family class I SAM-dependent methyltransferase n=1 Tax=Escherichia coli TaxID=562 RepID=UPI000699F3BE|nr:N-6 DNA methylase [Escherichia coli]EFN8884678.1 SAM-dependent methyltransferase [Escherichia coli]CTR13955.1 type I restriction-modification system methyltransferase subunit [Escherichia coli]GDD57403.1 putative type I restriction enzyme BthVORF4518P M protein [Escherichia coli]HAM9172072.1 N-6 DNA methylase [Escherichia coli]HAM9314683.1 N-6 DNA methylase [Escherichia coli]